MNTQSLFYMPKYKNSTLYGMLIIFTILVIFFALIAQISVIILILPIAASVVLGLTGVLLLIPNPVLAFKALSWTFLLFSIFSSNILIYDYINNVVYTEGSEQFGTTAFIILMVIAFIISYFLQFIISLSKKKARN